MYEHMEKKNNTMQIFFPQRKPPKAIERNQIWHNAIISQSQVFTVKYISTELTGILSS